MVREWMAMLRGVVLAIVLVLSSARAHATGAGWDIFGEGIELVWLSEDGTKALVVRSSKRMATHEDRPCNYRQSLEVVRLPDSTLASIALSNPYKDPDSPELPCESTRQDFVDEFTSSRATKEVRDLIALHGLTVEPVFARESPDRTRFAFIGTGKDEGGVYLIEGTKLTILKKWRLGGDPGSGWEESHPRQGRQAIDIAWSPDGRTLLAVGYFGAVGPHPRSDDVTFRYAPLVYSKRFTGPSRVALDQRTVAEQLNDQGFRYYQEGKFRSQLKHDGVSDEDPAAFYEAAVKRDAKYEQAIYNLACMMSLMGDLDRTLARLAELRALNTKKARKLLKKARKDEDFMAYWKDAGFLDATN